jgi:hypothetical protein
LNRGNVTYFAVPNRDCPKIWHLPYRANISLSPVLTWLILGMKIISSRKLNKSLTNVCRTSIGGVIPVPELQIPSQITPASCDEFRWEFTH